MGKVEEYALRKRGAKCYIAGKITGMDISESKKQFAQAQAALEELGYDTVNPHALCADIDSLPEEQRAWGNYMSRCLAALALCSHIYMLPNWVDSKGAKVEHAAALGMGIKRVFI
jgi:hypothetical protein